MELEVWYPTMPFELMIALKGKDNSCTKFSFTLGDENLLVQNKEEGRIEHFFVAFGADQVKRVKKEHAPSLRKKRCYVLPSSLFCT